MTIRIATFYFDAGALVQRTLVADSDPSEGPATLTGTLGRHPQLPTELVDAIESTLGRHEVEIGARTITLRVPQEPCDELPPEAYAAAAVVAILALTDTISRDLAESCCLQLVTGHERTWPEPRVLDPVLLGQLDRPSRLTVLWPEGGKARLHTNHGVRVATSLDTLVEYLRGEASLALPSYLEYPVQALPEPRHTRPLWSAATSQALLAAALGSHSLIFLTQGFAPESLIREAVDVLLSLLGSEADGESGESPATHRGQVGRHFYPLAEDYSLDIGASVLLYPSLTSSSAWEVDRCFEWLRSPYTEGSRNLLKVSSVRLESVYADLTLDRARDSGLALFPRLEIAAGGSADGPTLEELIEQLASARRFQQVRRDRPLTLAAHRAMDLLSASDRTPTRRRAVMRLALTFADLDASVEIYPRHLEQAFFYQPTAEDHRFSERLSKFSPAGG